jgi:hypothetical protein
MHVCIYIWDDNFQTDLEELGQKGVDLIHLAQDKGEWRAVIKMIMNLRVP